jgi:hypothetical protein
MHLEMKTPSVPYWISIFFLTQTKVIKQKSRPMVGFPLSNSVNYFAASAGAAAAAVESAAGAASSTTGAASSAAGVVSSVVVSSVAASSVLLLQAVKATKEVTAKAKNSFFISFWFWVNEWDKDKMPKPISPNFSKEILIGMKKMIR